MLAFDRGMSHGQSNVNLHLPSYPADYPSPSTLMSGMSGPVSQYTGYSMSDGHIQTDPQTGAPMQALNLPPIRAGDGRVQVQGQAPPPAHLQSQSQASPSQQPGQAPPMQYYLAPGQAFPMPGVDPSQPMRFAIPPADSRIMSGGRHKKEIKRRTKTGCLTCRKRRIKCDEQHPACRNCQKSKRECLGYDPIFKSQPGPAAIQPALGSAPLNHHSPTASHYSQTYSSGYPSYPPLGVTSENSVGSNEDSTAIDPALGAAMAHGGDGTADLPGHRAKRTRIEDLLALGGCPPPPLPPPSAIPDTIWKEIIHIYNSVFAPAIDRFLETKWFVSRGESHLLANGALCNHFRDVLQRYTINPREPNYGHHLAATMSSEASLIWSLMGMCRQQAPPSYPPVKAESEQQPAPPHTPSESKFTDEDFKEGVRLAAKRVEIFEALLTGDHLPTDSSPTGGPSTRKSSSSDPSSTANTGTDNTRANGTAEPPSSTTSTVFGDQLKSRELSFWSLVHTFLTLHDDEASSAKEIDDTVASCRTLLDSYENRDVIYSIVIARHVGARLAESAAAAGSGSSAQQQQAQNNDESDQRTKLLVAKKFLEEEAGGKGMNQIVQRLTAMAVRTWAR